MSKGQVEAGPQEDNWRVHGEVDLDAVVSLQRRALELFHQGIPQAIDLAAVERADSSGIALLVDWQRRARRAGKEIRFINAPSFLGRIAALYGLADLLGLAASDSDLGTGSGNA